jgi:hypothetical protein
MNSTQTSYLLQKVAPLVMRELGPRLEPIITEKITIPIAKKIGPPLARRIGIPLARKTGTIFLNKVGYPLVQKALLKANVNLPNINLNDPGTPNNVPAPAQEPEPGQSSTAVKRKRKSLGLAKIIQSRKAKKAKRNNLFSPKVTNNQPIPPGRNPQIPPQAGFEPNLQAPLPNMNPGTALNSSRPVGGNPFDFNHNPSLFGRRRQHSIYGLE